MRRPLDVPPDREIGFVSFVRASGRGEAACLRERVMLLNAGLPILEFSSASPPALIDCCVLIWVLSICLNSCCYMHRF